MHINKKGFLLLELMIGMALSIVICGFIGSSLREIIRGYYNIQKALRVLQTIRESRTSDNIPVEALERNIPRLSASSYARGYTDNCAQLYTLYEFKYNTLLYTVLKRKHI